LRVHIASDQKSKEDKKISRKGRTEGKETFKGLLECSVTKATRSKRRVWGDGGGMDRTEEEKTQEKRRARMSYLRTIAAGGKQTNPTHTAERGKKKAML